MPTWYVRPDTSHNVTRDGTSYATAWGGWSEIPWGTTLFGTVVQQTVYVCGSHTYASSIGVGNTGCTASNPTIIRGDYGPDPGSLSFTDAAIGNRLYSVGKRFTQHLNLTIVNGQIYVGFNVNAGDNILISNVTITPVSSSADAIVIDGSVVNSSYSNITVTNCVVNGGKRFLVWYCDQASGSGYSNISNLTVTNNKLSNLADSGIEVRTTSRVDKTNTYARYVTITGNTISKSGQGASGGLFVRLDVSNGLSASQSYGCVVTDNNFDTGGYLSANDPLGGVGYCGFASPKKDYTENIIARNNISNVWGAVGGIDIIRAEYVDVFDNTITNIYTSTQNNPIDGAGIFIDQGTKFVRVHRNTIKNTPGNSLVWNSGYAIVFYNAFDAEVYSNECVGNKYGICASNQVTVYCDGTSGANTITFASGTYGQTLFSSPVYPGMQVSGTGIGANAFIGSVSGSSSLYTVTLVDANGAAVNNTGTITGGLITFKMPTTVTYSVQNNLFKNSSDSGVYLRDSQVKIRLLNNIVKNETGNAIIGGIKKINSVSNDLFANNLFVNEPVDSSYLVLNRYLSESFSSPLSDRASGFYVSEFSNLTYETLEKSPKNSSFQIGPRN